MLLLSRLHFIIGKPGLICSLRARLGAVSGRGGRCAQALAVETMSSQIDFGVLRLLADTLVAVQQVAELSGHLVFAGRMQRPQWRPASF
jgi:hypothetical protein